ncbi:hypothetical protein NSK_008577 [Nannochloropsis salina CCMP1776]|jgi:hypothetical protein|uniref:Uncharacterized protein n=1 Tax=Nannochloropsis salina CCMP1776 TaxID=1027361 RepID=A0A4D9CTG3_9STRA|nr:hypothetical protein NSK_008577 [Nannochloropsis salina CCMP1776]|eukprot:TFJ80019.1 hypothetical protein NSK_008577 [Nannochloropsis salina CCMP1776]
MSYEPADAEDDNMKLDGTGEGEDDKPPGNKGSPVTRNRVSRSNSVSSAPGTPSQIAKKSQPGYLAENWQELTTALEQAAQNREALRQARGSSSAVSDAGGKGDGQSPSMSRSGSGSSQRSGKDRSASFSSDSGHDRASDDRLMKSPQHAAFAKKRMSHYDEYKRLQEWRKAHEGEEEEDEEEKEEKGEGNKGPGKGINHSEAEKTAEK